MNLITASTLTGIIITMAGCVGLSKVEMSPSDQAHTRTIHVRVEDRLPEDMFFHGTAQSVGGAFGVVGALAGMALSETPKAQIISAMENNGIKLPIILQKEFANAVQSTGEFQVVDSQSLSDAEMLLIVNIYGLAQSHGFNSNLYPMLNVSGSLRKPDGTVIWQRTESMTALNEQNDKGYEFDQYMENPERLREVWSNASRIVSRMLVRELTSHK